MASFYNPFSPKPDIGQGMGDIFSQIMQVMMMKKMFPKQKTSVGQTPLQQPQPGMTGMPGISQSGLSSQAPGAMGGAEGQFPEGMTADQIRQILMMLQSGSFMGQQR